MRKSLLTYLSEAVDAYRSDKSHLSTDGNSSPVVITQNPIRHPPAWLKWLIPNGGTILIVLVLLLTQTVWARNDLPEAVNSSVTTISYQGRLLDGNGQPVNDPGLGISFRLYDVDTGGAPLWSEDHIGVPVQEGLFHVLLGSIVPIPVSLLSGNDTLWLGIQIGSDTEMTPREQIAGVPFAMVAGTVLNEAITTEKIADQAVTQAKLGADVNLLPPPNSIDTAMIQDAAITTDKIADGAISATKLNLPNDQMCTAEIQIPVPGNWETVQVPNGTISVNFEQQSTILLWTAGHFTFTPGPESYHAGTAIKLDGVTVASTATTSATGGWREFNALRFLSVTSGTHLLELAAFSQGPGTVHISQDSCMGFLVIGN